MQQLQIYNVLLTAQKYRHICILVYFLFVCLFVNVIYITNLLGSPFIQRRKVGLLMKDEM